MRKGRQLDALRPFANPKAGNSMRLLRLVAGRSLAVSVLVAFAARAAVAPPLSLEAVTDRSPLIVEGHVAHSWAAWDPHHRYIWTHYEVQVSDAMRGSVATVTVSEPGGSIDGINQAFSGSIGYSPGEHVVLFLFRTPIGYWRTTGGSQGKFTVRNNGLVHSELKRGGVTAAGSGAPEIPLSEFRSLVHSLARARAAQEVR